MRRHHWKLSAVQKENLHQYLAQEPVLQALYFAKQQLNGFLVMKSLKRKRTQKMMPQFLALIAQFEQSPARALAQTLKSWLETIIRMWRFTKSNGITEGFHTKMEMLSRRAYGFRNFENYRHEGLGPVRLERGDQPCLVNAHPPVCGVEPETVPKRTLRKIPQYWRL